jgi:hypothetical protein
VASLYAEALRCFAVAVEAAGVQEELRIYEYVA